jgi:hypothetical protein
VRGQQWLALGAKLGANSAEPVPEFIVRGRIDIRRRKFVGQILAVPATPPLSAAGMDSESSIA